MNKLSILFLILFSNGLIAQQKETIIRALDKRNKEIRCYNVKYSTSFIHSDTVTLDVNSFVDVKKGKIYTGWHEITIRELPKGKRLVATNMDELVILSYKDSSYKIVKQDFNDPKNLDKEKSIFLFPPMYRTLDKFMDYELQGIEGNYAIFKLSEELKDLNSGEMTTCVTVVTVNTATNTAEKEEQWTSVRGKNVNHTVFLLKSLEIYDKIKSDWIHKRSDSLIKDIKKHRIAGNSDPSAQPEYKVVKKGDQAFPFSAAIHGTTDTFRLSDFKDRIVILDFFYTTCGPCVASIPDLQKIQKDFADRGVSLVGFNPIQADWRNLDMFISYFKIDYTILKGTKTTSREYGVDGYPKLFIIKNGIIVKIYDGFENGLAKELEKELTKLLKQ